MKHLLTYFSILLMAVNTNISSAASSFTRVDMMNMGASTFYVKGEILGLGKVNLMVDTGSGYSTINEHTLKVLKKNGAARYVKDLIGILANGEKMRVEIYLLSAINIGGSCWLRNIEAAVFPGNTRQILGLSALRKTSPFLFSMEPPELKLSNCEKQLKS